MSPGPDTIVAVATPRGRGAIGIIRLSGPAALEAVRPLVPQLPAEPVPRHAYWSPLLDGGGRPLDEGLVLSFLPESSVTGEAVVELHSHGSPTVQALLLEALLDHAGVRLAEAGEFTERAFLNGRIDLARAEAVADLIAAEGEASARAAAAQLGGALGEAVRAVRAPLVELQADLEALLDFPDEAVEVEVSIAPRLAAVRERVAELRASAARGRLLRRGARVVLAGPVNAGKSTLFNRLVGEERALVDPVPGTTRDVLEAPGELEGLAITWVDTAGLGDATGRVEAMGMERTRREVKEADVLLRVVPAGTPLVVRQRCESELGAALALDVASKTDLLAPGPEEGLGVSARTGEGLDALRMRLVEMLRGTGVDEAAPAVSERHAEALGRAEQSLRAAEAAQGPGALELAAAEVMTALEALGEITGETATPEVLQAIFRRFCIGK
jgi:tRNA modification GTPase